MKKRLMKLFEESNIDELNQMYAYSNLDHNKHADAYEDAAKMLDTYIELHKDHEIKNEHHKMQSEFNELIKKATDVELIDAYKSTLNQDGSVKHGHGHASKFLDTLLENRGISRNAKGDVYINTREFGTPYNQLLHRKTTHRKTTSQRGGSYKKRRRRSLKKSMRVKRRKTHSTRKRRK